jgi:hypothetical protein
VDEKIDGKAANIGNGLLHSKPTSRSFSSTTFPGGPMPEGIFDMRVAHVFAWFINQKLEN